MERSTQTTPSRQDRPRQMAKRHRSNKVEIGNQEFQALPPKKILRVRMMVSQLLPRGCALSCTLADSLQFQLYSKFASIRKKLRLSEKSYNFDDSDWAGHAEAGR